MPELHDVTYVLKCAASTEILKQLIIYETVTWRLQSINMHINGSYYIKIVKSCEISVYFVLVLNQSKSKQNVLKLPWKQNNSV